MSVAVSGHRIQALTALERANAAKLGMRDVKRDVAAGRVSLAEALEDSRSGPMPVLALLMAQPRWGRKRALLALAKCFVEQGARVRELSARQRDALGCVRL